MRAAWYEQPGPAAEVLQVGEMAEPEPNPGEVRVRVALSRVNPGDTKKRGTGSEPGCRTGAATRVGVRGAVIPQVDGAAAHPVALNQAQPDQAIRVHAPRGTHRIIEVAFSENADLDAAVAAPDGVIAAYATRRDRPDFPFWPMLFANLTIRLLGSDDFPCDETPSCRRSHHRSARGSTLDSERRSLAHGPHRRSTRSSRRRDAQAHVAGDPEVT